MVKRFLQAKSGGGGQGSRHAPQIVRDAPQFTLRTRKAIVADAEELAMNPRARSAKLRVATRTDAAPAPVDRKSIGMPLLKGDR